MKIKVISFYSKVISFLLALFGFTACDIINPTAEYGVPSATFKVKGTLVDEADNTKTINGVKVAIGHLYTDDTGVKKTYYTDSIITNTTGRFNFSAEDFPTSRKFVIKYEDVNAAQDGNYGLTIDTVRFENPDFTGGNGNWYEGETTKDLGKVKLSQIKDKK